MNRAMFAQLNMPPEESGGGTLGRVLSRLGSFTELIVGPLNMRPTGAQLLAADDARVEVRVSTAGSHVLVVLVPDGDLAAEVFFLRSLAHKQLPAPRLIAHDLSGSPVPYSWAVLSHVPGAPLSLVADDTLVRLAARQVGRALRRAHQLEAPGCGRPQPTGRWPQRSWREVLGVWLARHSARPAAGELLGAELAAALWAETLEHPELECEQPRVLHGAVGPERAIVTGADRSIQLEALARPGEIVGGDPLFDLALGLSTRQPEPFRRGLLEGYEAAGPLDDAQRRRLRRLRLLEQLVLTLETARTDDLAALPRLVDRELAALSG
jgi:aminoglycoside phosphotransferase (APT) family kinase protein